MIALFAEPLGDGGRREERDVVRKRVQRIKGQMIRVGVCQQDRVQLGQRFERYAGSADTRKKLSQRWVKVRIGEEALPTDLN